MKKSFKLENLDCAFCAEKIEKGVSELESVNSAKVSFMTQKLIIDADNLEEALVDAQKVVNKVERKCKIIF